MQKKQEALTNLIDDEVIIIETSGEMPEVALHGALYYLCQDIEGPEVTLHRPQLLKLKLAVIEGYRKIILRDLQLENRDKAIYRGVARSAINWQRMIRFCEAEYLDSQEVCREVRLALRRFLVVELGDVKNGSRESCINCSQETLEMFMQAVGLDLGEIPSGWEELLT